MQIFSCKLAIICVANIVFFQIYFKTEVWGYIFSFITEDMKSDTVLIIPDWSQRGEVVDVHAIILGPGR